MGTSSSSLRIDDRTGSRELAKYFLDYGITPKVTRLEFGDLAFNGQGPSGECAIAVERKQIDDLVASIQSKRLSGHQIPGMIENYDYSYVLVEGIWKAGKSGELMVMGHGGRWAARETPTRAINNYLMGLTLRAGVIVWRTSSPEETVSFIVDQVRMWEKEWHEHKSHEGVYAPAMSNGAGRHGFFNNLHPRRVTVRERIALQLPGMDDRAKFVEGWFASAKEMCSAGPETWANKVWKTRGRHGQAGKERRLGKAAAEKIVEALRGAD